MDRIERLKIRSKIDKKCCKHIITCSNRYTIYYLFGWKRCKIAMCNDCGEIQLVGDWLGNLICRLVGRLRARELVLAGEVVVF